MDSGSSSPMAPRSLSPVSISLPPLAKERQRAAARMSLGAVSSVASLGSLAAAAATNHSRNTSSASGSQFSTARTAHTRDSSSTGSEYTGAFSYASTLAGIPADILSEQKTAGHWVAFNGGLESSPLLPGPNGGGGVGLPNFVPLGHPSLSLAAMGGENARQRHGNKTLLAAGLLEGTGSKFGLEGAPFVSAADRNRAESRNVSEATMLLASLARDAAAHGTPRTIEKHNTTLAQLRIAAAGGAGNRNFNPTSTFNPHGPSGGPPGSGGSNMPRAMPAFEVDKFLRANQRMMSTQDRMSAADVLRIEPYERDSAQLSTLSKFLQSVDFFSGLSDSLRTSLAGIATSRVLRKDECVYQEGDESLHLFVVLSGAVGTRVKDFLNPTGNPGFVAATAGVGELFGQETLGGDEKTVVRTQTKVALERTELLLVDMRDYKAMLRASLSKDAGDKIAFLASLPLFESASLRELSRVSTAMQSVSYPKNHLVLKQGSNSDRVYWIVSGEVRVITKVYQKVAVIEKPPPTAVGTHARSASKAAVAAAMASRRNKAAESGGEDAEAEDEEDQEEADAMRGYDSGPAGGRASPAPSGSHSRSRSSAFGSAAGASAAHARSSSLAALAAIPSPSNASGAATAKSAAKHSRHPSTAKAGGGAGAYKFERARAFTADRDATRRSAADGGGGGGVGFGSTTRSSVLDSAVRPVVSAPVRKHVLQPQLLDLGRLGPQWFFGEMGVLLDAPRSASVYAETTVDLLWLSRDDFFARLPASALAYMRDYIAAFYAPTAVLKEQWKQQQRWEQFKKKMIQNQRRDANGSIAATANSFSATLNAAKY